MLSDEEIKEMDSDQLGQLIRMNAHFLDVYMKCENKGFEIEEAYLRLLVYISEWNSRKYTLGPDKEWAESIITLYNDWQLNNRKRKTAPINTSKIPDIDIMKIIQERRSIRFWKNQPVPRDILNKLIEGAVFAPSAFNRMPWKFYIAENEIENMIEGDASNKSMIEKAPARIYIAIDERLYEEKYAPAMDAALAAQNILLTAHSLGLGACLVYQGEIVDQEKVKTSLHIPDYYMVYCVILAGYPDEQPVTPGRVNVSDVTVFIKTDEKLPH